jgi:hypothetical protein
MQLQRQGVKATREVQTAGRKVDEENKRLRALLRLQGLTDANIEEYLSPKSSQVSGASAYHKSPSRPMLQPHLVLSENETPIGIVPNHSAKEDDPGSRQHLFQRQPIDLCSERVSPGSTGASIYSSAGSDNVSMRKTTGTQVDSPVRSGVDNGFHSKTSATVSRSGSNQGQMTPCETAASIIAGMPGYRDVNDVRQELGCTAPNCAVENMTLFEMLDR